MHGFKEAKDLGWLLTFSSTMEPGLMRLALLKGLIKKWKAAKGDVIAAILKADSDEELYIRLPKDLPEEAKAMGYEPGGISLQLKALYGRADSPRLFTQAFKQMAAEHDWKEVDESILVHMRADDEIDGLLFMHMDDMLCLSNDPVAMLEQLSAKMEMGDIELLHETAESIYTGLDIKWDGAGGRCEIGQKRYVDNIKTQLTDREKRKVFGPEDLKQSEESERNPAYGQAQQAWTGVLGWASKTQRHLLVVFSEVSRNAARASPKTLVAVQRACEYAKRTHRPLVLEGVRDPVLVWWVDASYSLHSCEGRIGYEVQVLDSSVVSSVNERMHLLPTSNVIAWKSHRCSRKLASTTSAELVALVESVKLAPRYLDLVKSL